MSDVPAKAIGRFGKGAAVGLAGGDGLARGRRRRARASDGHRDARGTPRGRRGRDGAGEPPLQREDRRPGHTTTDQGPGHDRGDRQLAAAAAVAAAAGRPRRPELLTAVDAIDPAGFVGVPHLAQVIPPGMRRPAAGSCRSRRAHCGRAGPGATSGGLAARPASPLRGATGRAGRWLDGAIGGGAGVGGGRDRAWAAACVGRRCSHSASAPMPRAAELRPRAAATGWVAVAAADSAGAAACGVGSGRGPPLPVGGGSAAAAARRRRARAAGSARPGSTLPSRCRALAGSIARAPLHSRNALHEAQKVASSGILVAAVRTDDHADPSSSQPGPGHYPRWPDARRADGPAAMAGDHFPCRPPMLVRLDARSRKADNLLVTHDACAG